MKILNLNVRSAQAPNCQTFKINKNKINKWKFVYLLGSCFSLPSDWGGYTLYTRKPFLIFWGKENLNEGIDSVQKSISSFIIFLFATYVSERKYLFI